ncbi:MAG: sigma-70 family RNA polymerase sigma factor [bacterium]
MNPNELIKDEQLVDDVLAGNINAYNQLVTRYFGMVYMIGYARFKRRESGEDLAQETFLQAFLHLSNLKQPQLFPAWVCRIARNLATDWQRHNQRVSKLLPMVPLDELPKEPIDSCNIDVRERLDITGQNKVVQEAILKLPAELREIVLLYYSEGLNKEEIARLLGIHHTTVGRQLKKALSILKDILEPVLRESIQPLRASQKATLRSISIITAAAVLSSSSKAALITAAGDIAETTILSLTQPLEIGMATTLNNIFGNIVQGSKFVSIKIIIATAIVVTGVIGGIYFYQNHINTQNKNYAQSNANDLINNNAKNMERQNSSNNNNLSIMPNHIDSAHLAAQNLNGVPSFSGNYYAYGGAPMEIQKNTNGTFDITDGEAKFTGEQQGNRLICFFSKESSFIEGSWITFGKDTWMLILESDGETLDMIESHGTLIPNIGRRIEDSNLWATLKSYSKHDYPNAVSGFRQYLQLHPNDSFIQLSLTDSLLHQNKVEEVKKELARLEKMPDKQPEALYQMMVPKIKYELTGKEESVKNENSWDELKKVIEQYDNSKQSFKNDSTIQYVFYYHNPIRDKEKQMFQEYISPNLEVIQKFMSLPEAVDYHIADNQSIGRAKIILMVRAIILYGYLQSDKGNLNQAVEAYRRVVRLGQLLTHGSLIQNLIAISIRQYGIDGFATLYTEGKITNSNDAQFVFDTLKGLQRQDPIKTKDNLHEFEPKGDWNMPGSSLPLAMRRANCTETDLIILETVAAIKLYQLQHGAFPANLQDLIPKYLSIVPVDTFSRNPLKCYPTPRGIIVYSYGPDKIDDKGRIIYDPKKDIENGKIASGDLVIEVK